MAHTDYFGALVLGNVLCVNLDFYSFKSIMSLNPDYDNTVDHMDVQVGQFAYTTRPALRSRQHRLNVDIKAEPS